MFSESGSRASLVTLWPALVMLITTLAAVTLALLSIFVDIRQSILDCASQTKGLHESLLDFECRSEGFPQKMGTNL